MKILYFLTLCGGLWVLPNALEAQSRNVDWIHGLGGNATSWEDISNTYVGQRQITGEVRGDYNTANGIPNFANQVQANTGIRVVPTPSPFRTVWAVR